MPDDRYIHTSTAIASVNGFWFVMHLLIIICLKKRCNGVRKSKKTKVLFKIHPTGTICKK